MGWIAVALVAGAASAFASSCIIADPPAELPKPRPHRPLILHESVVPPPTTVLTAWPAEFVVPVETLDPGAVFQWRFFVDFQTGVGIGTFLPGDSLPADDDGGVRIIPVAAGALEPTLPACHVVEMLVANSFAGTHTADALGGDSVVWIYNPSGDVGGCPTFDAGSQYDASFPDAAAAIDSGPILTDSGGP